MAVSEGEEPGLAAGQVQRLDQWLWFSRVLKSRTMAARLVAGGKVRVNRARVVKPSHAVRPEDVLTIAFGGKVQILKVLAVGARRGPPQEAKLLYQVLGDAHPPGEAAGKRNPVAGRPSKRDRRATARLAEQN